MGIFFVAFIGADYNLYDYNLIVIYKITLFSYWVVLVVERGVHYDQWKHSGKWKYFFKTIHDAFRNNRTNNLLIRRGISNILRNFRRFPTLVQHKLFPS